MKSGDWGYQARLWALSTPLPPNLRQQCRFGPQVVVLALPTFGGPCLQQLVVVLIREQRDVRVVPGHLRERGGARQASHDTATMLTETARIGYIKR